MKYAMVFCQIIDKFFFPSREINHENENVLSFAVVDNALSILIQKQTLNIYYILLNM